MPQMAGYRLALAFTAIPLALVEGNLLQQAFFN
jgi:hypothetical protein